MKKMMKPASLLVAILMACVVACQKKNPEKLNPGTANTGYDTQARSTGGTTSTTTFTVPNLVGHIIGSSEFDYLGDKNVFSLNGGTYSGEPPLLNSTTDNYYGAAAYDDYKAVVYRSNSAPTTTKLLFMQPGSTLSPYYDLKLGSATGPDFLPDEIEFINATASSLYAIQGNSIYRIDGLTTASVAYAVLVYTFPTSPVNWSFFRKAISHGDAAGELKVFIAETASAKGSSVNNIKVYTLSGLAGTPTLSSLESTITLSYNNTQNLSAFSIRTNASASDWYHIVIGNSSTNTSTTYQLTGTTGTLGSTPSAVTAFPAYVNDCSLYMD